MSSLSQLMSRPYNTNIPHKEGIAAVINFMEKYMCLLPTNCPPHHIIHITLDFIFKESTFKFMNTIYTKSLAVPWELGWLSPMLTCTWARRNAK